MVQSKITSKYQVTVPKEIRDKLGLKPGDRLVWEAVGDQARVAPARSAFLERCGTIKVGPGNVVDDVREARRLRGISGVAGFPAAPDRKR